jgi:hypothetical protein
MPTCQSWSQRCRDDGQSRTQLRSLDRARSRKSAALLRVHVRVWNDAGRVRSDAHERGVAVLRVPDAARFRCALDCARPRIGGLALVGVRDMGADDLALRERTKPWIQGLWSPWNRRLQALARVVRRFSARYGLSTWIGVLARSHRRERSVRAWELSMGDRDAAGAQSTLEPTLHRRVGYANAR